MRYNVNEEWEGPQQRVTDNAVNAGIDVFACVRLSLQNFLQIA